MNSHLFFFFQAEDGIRDYKVTGVQTCALPIWDRGMHEIVVITGASAGAGRATAIEFARQGAAAVVLLARGRDGLEGARRRSEERRVGKEGRPRGGAGE